MKRMYRGILILAVILSDIMCAVVGYEYCEMTWEIRYAGYSAPASTAFFLAIPYVIGIVICLVLAVHFRRKAYAEHRGEKQE